MRFEMPIRPTENMKSAIVNCVCPDCGGAIYLSTSEFRCGGLCGKDWRAVWEGARYDAKQAHGGNNLRRVRRS